MNIIRICLLIVVIFGAGRAYFSQSYIEFAAMVVCSLLLIVSFAIKAKTGRQ